MGPVLQVSANTETTTSGVAALASPESLLAPSSNLAVVDRWLALEAELTPLGPKIRERDELHTRILSWFPELPADKGTTVAGTDAIVWISVRDNARTITEKGKRGLQKLWGLRVFRKNAWFALKQLPDEKDPQGLYTVQERTGPRHLKALPRLKPAA